MIFSSSPVQTLIEGSRWKQIVTLYRLRVVSDYCETQNNQNISPSCCSNNALSELPEAVFKLWSLRSLSAAQNKIEHLRLPSGGDPRETLPVLEELYLQVRDSDGRVEELYLKVGRLR